HRLLKREDRLLASDEEGRGHVRKYDGVAQRQHRIGPGLTGNEWWSRLSAGHGPKSVLLSLCLLKTSSAAEILVITDPNADRNKIEISTLYSDEKIPCSLPKIPCSLQKISCLFYRAIQFCHGLALSVFTGHRNLAYPARPSYRA